MKKKAKETIGIFFKTSHTSVMSSVPPDALVCSCCGHRAFLSLVKQRAGKVYLTSLTPVLAREGLLVTVSLCTCVQVLTVLLISYVSHFFPFRIIFVYDRAFSFSFSTDFQYRHSHLE